MIQFYIMNIPLLVYGSGFEDDKRIIVISHHSLLITNRFQIQIAVGSRQHSLLSRRL
jgi:hypothetical protein